MAIGLGDALLSWLVASAGDAVARRLRDAPATRALRQVVEHAAEVAVAKVAGHLDGHHAEHLRSSLLIRDSASRIDSAQVASEVELRHALHVWTAALDQPEFDEPGYLSELGVDAKLLADTLTSQIAAGIQRNGRGGGALDGLAAWLWRDGVGDHLARIERKLDASMGAVEPVGGGLPGGTPDFTGRQRALAELAERVRAHDPAGTVIAIHAVDGMAGVGKTEFALKAAHQHKHRYPDGQYFINLHGYTGGIPPTPPEAALEELLRQAGVPGQAIPGELAGRQARWQALMATRQALVLLDNALDVDQVRPLLPNAAGCLVLITSRTRLRGLPGARGLPLDVLPPAEAIELFTCLVDVGRQLDPDAVAQVVDVVGRLPVAVHAAAGQVDEDYTETELADELAEAKAGLGLVDPASPLGTGVHAVFETSLRRLDHAYQRAFWFLGVHPGPSIGVPQFAALAAMPIASARAMLRSLTDWNLITLDRDRVGHRRYQLHDLMREFARGQAVSHLSKEDQAAATTRLTAWYAAAMSAVSRLLARVRSTTGSGPEGAEVKVEVEGLDLDRLDTASRWLAAEQGNLLAFAEVAAGAAAAEVCWKAARTFFYLDYYATAQALYHAAIGFYRQADDRAGEATARWGWGELARLTGDYPAAAGHYHAAQMTFIGIGDRVGEAVALLGLGDVARLTGDYPAAIEHFRAARTTFVEIDALGGQAEALLGLGDVARLTGDYPAAAGLFRAARRTVVRVGDRPGEAEARWGMGDVARLTGDYPAAAEHYHAAQMTFIGIGDRAGEADAHRALGDVALATCDYAAAVEHYCVAETTYAEIGDHAKEAGARRGLANVALATGDDPAAAEHHSAPQTTDAEIGAQTTEAEEPVILGDVTKAQEKRDGADELWKRAHRIHDEIIDPHAATARNLLGRSRRANHRGDRRD